MIKIGLYIGLLFGGLVIATGSPAQTYTPINISGFNQDGIAESGFDATAVTTTALDLSSYIMYSQIFAAINSLDGGLPMALLYRVPVPGSCNPIPEIMYCIFPPAACRPIQRPRAL
jgi:hypothetical protein